LEAPAEVDAALTIAGKEFPALVAEEALAEVDTAPVVAKKEQVATEAIEEENSAEAISGGGGLTVL
jgi:hypothetical protein